MVIDAVALLYPIGRPGLNKIVGQFDKRRHRPYFLFQGLQALGLFWVLAPCLVLPGFVQLRGGGLLVVIWPWTRARLTINEPEAWVVATTAVS